MQIGSSKKEKWPSHFLDPSNKFPEPPLHLVSIGHNIFVFSFLCSSFCRKECKTWFAKKKETKNKKNERNHWGKKYDLIRFRNETRKKQTHIIDLSIASPSAEWNNSARRVPAPSEWSVCTQFVRAYNAQQPRHRCISNGRRQTPPLIGVSSEKIWQENLYTLSPSLQKK